MSLYTQETIIHRGDGQQDKTKQLFYTDLRCMSMQIDPVSGIKEKQACGKVTLKVKPESSHKKGGRVKVNRSLRRQT